jgi:ArsR family transcriptional regulator, virulence genes transcriptional regulator
MENVEKQIYELHASMCKVFSNPKRLEVINALREGEMSVGELSKKLGIPIGNLSQHLAIMKERGILNTRKEGNVVFYRLANPKMLKAFDILRDILFERISREGALIREAKK